MNAEQTCPCDRQAGGGFHGGRRLRMVFTVAAGLVLAMGVSGLFADGPDYNNPRLRKGEVVPSDSTTRERQEGWWNKRWKPATSDTNVAPLPAALNAKALLDKNSPEPWGGRWNPETGLSAGLWGRTLKTYTGTPGQIAVAFLADYRPLITGHETASDPGYITFHAARVTERKEYTVVHVQEFYKGVPVYGGGPVIHMDKAGHVTKLMGSCRPIGDIDVTPALDSAAAWDAVKRAILPDSIESFLWVRLSVFPGRSPRLIYDIFAVVGGYKPQSGSCTFLLDARTGELLEANVLKMDSRESKKARGDLENSSGTRDASPVDSSRYELRPCYRNVPIRRVPQEEWDAIKAHREPAWDSVKVPYDTTRPNPRPYRPSAEDRRRKEGEILDGHNSITTNDCRDHGNICLNASYY